MNNTKYEKLCNDWWRHACIGQLHKPFDTTSARHLHVKSLLVIYFLQVDFKWPASHILEVSHIHLCDWRRRLQRGLDSPHTLDLIITQFVLSDVETLSPLERVITHY